MNQVVLADAAAAAEALLHAERAERAASVAKMLAVLALCDLAQVDEAKLVEGAERWVTPGADGTPSVAEFVAGEVGALMGISPAAAFGRMATYLNLRHRHPTLFGLVVDGTVRVWEASRVADEAALAGLDAAACARLDHHCAVALAHQSWQRVRPQIARWIIEADPSLAGERAQRGAASRHVTLGPIADGHTDVWARLDARDGLDLDQALDHLADQLPDGASRPVRRAAALGTLARHALGQEELPTADDPCEHPRIRRSAELVVRVAAAALLDTTARGGAAVVDRWGAVLADRLGHLLSGSRVTVRPIIDPRTVSGQDGYVPATDLRIAAQERHPVDAFPFGSAAARRCDLDHTAPYDPEAPPGSRQTRLDNLAPLSRFAHRLKTHGGWRMSQHHSGSIEWVSPLGYRYLTTPDGSVLIGRPPPRPDPWWHREPPDEPDPPERVDPTSARPPSGPPEFP